MSATEMLSDVTKTGIHVDGDDTILAKSFMERIDDLHGLADSSPMEGNARRWREEKLFTKAADVARTLQKR